MDFTYLQEHLDELVNYMREHKYAETYIDRYRTTVSQIVSNTADYSWGSYNDVYIWYEGQLYKESYLRNIRAILGKLERFHLYGTYPDGYLSTSSFWKKRAAYYQLSSQYRGLIDFYNQTERKRGLKETTIYSGAHKAASFLLALQSRGEDALEKITEANVLSCFVEDGKKIRGASCAGKITAFFSVCTPLNPTECQRIAKYIPALRVARKNISYLTKEECAMIRAALDDHGNGLRYKDRAIGFLLLYTGMRGGDIANLLLTSIDWGNDKICFIQQKTQNFLDFPLTAIVGNAIYDYCVYERPDVGNAYLFLSCFSPHGSLTTDGIGTAVGRIMEKAGVRQYSGARKGTHVFRHRLATALLENGISQPIISNALGHTAPCSLESYLYADMAHLKECALDVTQYAIAEGVFSRA